MQNSRSFENIYLGVSAAKNARLLSCLLQYTKALVVLLSVTYATFSSSEKFD
jgi:hypothetical protein